MSDNWNQMPANRQSPDPQGPSPRRSTGLLSNYRQNQGEASVKQYSPSSPAPAPVPLSGAGGRAPTGRLLGPGGLPATQRPHGLLSSTMQAVRDWSGKVAAINKNYYEPPAPPLTRYHSDPGIGTMDAQPRVRPWKRSHAVRMALRKRHRRTQLGSPAQRIGLGLVVAFLLLTVVLGSSGSAYGYYYYQSQLPLVAQYANKQISQVTRIYDRNGVLLAQLHDPTDLRSYRSYVNYQDIPQVMKDAMVAAENRSFWTDNGVDPLAVARATLGDLTHQSQSGASTITMQVVKNLSLNSQQDLVNRKIPEAAVAIGMTQKYPKSKILELYFNVAPFGTTQIGVEMAAQDYFGLKRQCNQDFSQGVFQCMPAVAQLDYNPVTHKHDPYLALARATLLASLPQDPVDYYPMNWSDNPNEKAVVLDRQQYVLDSMNTLPVLVAGLGANGAPGPITDAVKKKVHDITAKMTFSMPNNTFKCPHFVYWVTGQIEQALGHGSNADGVTLFNVGGYNIRTTIDVNLETYVEDSIKHHLDDPTYEHWLGNVILSRDYNVGDGAAVVENSHTGEILAMAGSKDYTNKAKDPRVSGYFNAATGNNGDTLGRQPGSSIKPIVYATAFEMGWYPGIVVDDHHTYFPNGMPSGTPITSASVYDPTDYGGKWNNRSFTLRDALANSFNVPAARVLAYAGLDNVINTAERMGITAVEPKAQECHQKHLPMIHCYQTSFALGTQEIPLIQMVGAYQVFSNHGVKVAQQGVLDIWDNYGNHLYHFDKTKVKGVQVLSPQVAYIMSAVMSDEHARHPEFYDDHDLSFADWDPTCLQTGMSYSAPGNAPYPDCSKHQVAAKTGTTENFVDNLTLGYTPDVVVGVWVGNANNKPFGTGVVGITGAGPIWHSVIERASGGPCIEDGGSCSQVDVPKLGLEAQGVFIPVTDGVDVKCVSGMDGLLGCGGKNDFIITGMEPLQAGIPLPASDNKGKGTKGGKKTG